MPSPCSRCLAKNASGFKIRGGFGEDRELRHEELHPTDTRGDPGPGMPRSRGVDLDPCPRLLFPLPPLPVRGDRLRLRVGRSAGKDPLNQCLCTACLYFHPSPPGFKMALPNPSLLATARCDPLRGHLVGGFRVCAGHVIGLEFPRESILECAEWP